MRKINVLSLFDGLGGARIALDRMGIECNYYASEIDKYAIKVSSANYPDIIHLGDVQNIKSSDLPKIDLLIGGSPCQDLSVAKNNREGLKGEKSRLFYEYLRLLEELKPKHFVLENVFSMGKENCDKISKLLGYSPIMINSALLTAQNRKRYYWTNFLVMQPADRGILLKDIIEDGAVVRDKSNTIPATIYRENVKSMVKRNKMGLVVSTIKIGHFGQDKRQDRVYSPGGKSVTLCGNGGGQGAKTGLYAIAQRGRNIVDGKRKDIKGSVTEQRLETSFIEKSNCLTTVQKDSLLLAIKDGDVIVRKLTPIECERLQGVNDNYTNHVSNTQRYRMIGNGFTVTVIEHILSHIKEVTDGNS